MTTATFFSKPDVSYKYKLSFLVAIVFTGLVRLILQGSEVENDLWRNIAPLVTGALIGYLIGHLLDNWLESLHLTRKSNTRLKKKLQEQRIRQTWYAALFEKNQSILLLINSATGLIEEANPSACAFYGYSVEQLKRMHISEIDTLPAEAVELELKRAKLEKRQKLVSRHKLATGEEKDVELFSGSLVVDSINLLFLVVNDITEQKVLQGILPVCSHCKQIRNDNGGWDQIEEYIQQHSEARFSHGLCPSCAEVHYPSLYEFQQN